MSYNELILYDIMMQSDEYPSILSFSNESHLVLGSGCPAKWKTVSTPSHAFSRVSIFSNSARITSPCGFISSTCSGGFEGCTSIK